MIEKIIDFLKRRKLAYLHVFNPKDQYVEIVLKDLAAFCRADRTTFHSDARLHAVAEGRREVWLRIMEHTKYNQEDFFEKYKLKIEAEA